MNRIAGITGPKWLVEHQIVVNRADEALRMRVGGRVARRVDAGQELIAPGAAPLRNLRNTCPQQVSPSQIAQLFNAMAS